MIIKTSGSESRGQEEAASTRIFKLILQWYTALFHTDTVHSLHWTILGVKQYWSMHMLYCVLCLSILQYIAILQYVCVWILVKKHFIW